MRAREAQLPRMRYCCTKMAFTFSRAYVIFYAIREASCIGGARIAIHDFKQFPAWDIPFCEGRSGKLAIVRVVGSGIYLCSYISLYPHVRRADRV